MPGLEFSTVSEQRFFDIQETNVLDSKALLNLLRHSVTGARFPLPPVAARHVAAKLLFEPQAGVHPGVMVLSLLIENWTNDGCVESPSS